MTILFVCAGNTCRSPLALAAWRALAAQDDVTQDDAAPESALSEIEAQSAGLSASRGAPATPHAQKIARGWKSELSSHRARPLTPKTARETDLILTMTRAQAQSVRRQFDLPLHRVRALGEFQAPALDDRVLGSQAASDAGQTDDDARWQTLFVTDDATLATDDFPANAREADSDIADPFGGSLEAYETCGARIWNAVRGLRHALQNGTIAL